jgi:hypothetical protein
MVFDNFAIKLNTETSLVPEIGGSVGRIESEIPSWRAKLCVDARSNTMKLIRG